jgi:hypothetical protein
VRRQGFHRLDHGVPTNTPTTLASAKSHVNVFAPYAELTWAI